MAARSGVVSRRDVLVAAPGVVMSPFATGEADKPADAAGRISKGLADAIHDHWLVHSELSRISNETDAVLLGREPTLEEWRRLDSASDHERDLFMRLCAFRAATDAERHIKASRLLAIFHGQEPSGEHVAAILTSMLDARFPFSTQAERQ